MIRFKSHILEVIQLAFLLSFLNAPLAAQEATLSSQARVSLITASPGSELYTIFGHTALRITDPVSGIDRTYNYGTFDFDTAGFYRKFAFGNLQYFLSVNPYEKAKQAYLKAGRTLTEQRLNLSPSQIQRLYNYLQANARPENRYYSYEFFYDNCTTRVFEALKTVAGDSIRFQKPLNREEQSYREYISPYLEPVPWIQFGINLLLGTPADRVPADRQTMFLPDLLKERFADARLQRADTSRALVHGQSMYVPSKPATINPSFITPAVVFWVLLGLVAPLSFIFRNRRTFWRWFDRFLFGTVGFLGLLILFLWVFSAYPSTKWNWNIVWTLPALIFLYIPINTEDIRIHQWRTRALVIAIMIFLILFYPFIQQSLPAIFLPLTILMSCRGWMIHWK